MPACPTARVAALFAGEPGLRQAAPCAGHADARPGVRHRRRALRPAIAGHGAGRTEVVLAEGGSKAAPAPRSRPAATPATPAVDARCAPPAPTPSPSSCSPRLDQDAQGGDQHPPHVVRQPAADAQSMPVLAEEPPVLVDWLPWNHTFGGNHNVGIVLDNGGTLYIDDGKPTPARHGRDAAQPARDRAHHLLQRADRLRGDRPRHETDAVLRRNLLSRVKMFFYSGAALSQPVWDSLHDAGGRGRRAHRHGHRPGHDRVGRPSRSSSPAPT
jgi:feruloyl-CoA synthase